MYRLFGDHEIEITNRTCHTCRKILIKFQHFNKMSRTLNIIKFVHVGQLIKLETAQKYYSSKKITEEVIDPIFFVIEYCK